MQQDIWQYYQAQYPGQVQVLGVDMFNGGPAQVTSFKNMTGATFPLLMLGATATGGNVRTLYNDGLNVVYWDDYVVINKQGIIRYHSLLTWPHTNRYHLNELRGTIDSLVTQTVGVEDVIATSFALGASPNPARDRTTVAFTNPGPRPLPLEISVHDVSGRRVAKLWSGPASTGITRAEWDGRSESGPPLPAGLYLVSARFGSRTLLTRVTILR